MQRSGWDVPHPDPLPQGDGATMWKQLRRAWGLLRQRLRRGGDERRASTARARFWAEVREGQREAEARSRP
jgi:hypothetical protein